MNVVGLVGSVAAGKSTVAEYLASLGAAWVDADRIAKECLRDDDIVAALVQRWGSEILAADGHVDRQQVAKRVFLKQAESNPELRFLESLVHPRTRLRIREAIAASAREKRECVLLDVPLLFESGWDLACDWVLCVDADREIRRARTLERGWDPDELDRREANQMTIEKKIRLSQVVMRNETTLLALHQNLRRQWPNLCRMERMSSRLTEPMPPHCLSDWTDDSDS